MCILCRAAVQCTLRRGDRLSGYKIVHIMYNRPYTLYIVHCLMRALLYHVSKLHKLFIFVRS